MRESRAIIASDIEPRLPSVEQRRNFAIGSAYREARLLRRICPPQAGHMTIVRECHGGFRTQGRRSQHRADPRARPGLDRPAADVDLGRRQYRADQLGARRARHRSETGAVGDDRRHRPRQHHRLRDFRRLYGDGPQDRRQSDGIEPLRLRAARRLSAERADVSDDARLDRREHVLPGEDRDGDPRSVRHRRYVVSEYHRHHCYHGDPGAASASMASTRSARSRNTRCR